MKSLAVFILIIFLILPFTGCSGTNALMDEDQLASESWAQYKVDNYLYGDEETLELLYRDGFHLGFNDLPLYDYEIRSDEEQMVFDDGYVDGVWNRTGE